MPQNVLYRGVTSLHGLGMGVPLYLPPPPRPKHYVPHMGICLGHGGGGRRSRPIDGWRNAHGEAVSEWSCVLARPAPPACSRVRAPPAPPRQRAPASARPVPPRPRSAARAPVPAPHPSPINCESTCGVVSLL